ncbi:hypothetical protein BGZ60DRAFT_528200 [Tricladium varicosporioides]|nr:hypothetical protein BGZ60DRAFT_528200 [Hymenoscyphus varicosporioides]
MASKRIEALKSALAVQADFVAAAHSFTEPTKQTIDDGGSEETLGEDLSSSWNAVIEVAANTQHEAQGPLVEILKAIQKQQIGIGGKRNEISVWGYQVKLWEDMPLFGATMRDAWNRAPGTGNRDDFSAVQWTNLNGFVARLTALSASIPAFDFSLYAIWTLRSAFEGSNEASAADIDAAKIWFKYAKDKIEELSHGRKSFEGPVARGGDKYRNKGWKGFTNERLAVWLAALQ